MVEIEFNEATKKVSFEPKSLVDLDEEAKSQADNTVTLLNQLMADLVAYNGEIPPPPNVASKNITTTASKLANNGVKALMSKKPEEAVKLLSTALETVLRRPLWEPTMQVLEEVASCLMPRCDAYIALNQWADAYADASLLMLLKAQDPMNHYRKGIILNSAGRKAEALEFLSSAEKMAPGNTVIKTAIASISKPE